MTSLIFGSIYMTHGAIVAHRRGKQREKNYKRWEDLRDEYDEQKKITRESRSLDLQRTGAWDPPEPEYTAREERPILTLRDQQEANDARLSWRPQEAWEDSHHTSNNPFAQQPQRTASVPAIPRYLQPQPTQQPQVQHEQQQQQQQQQQPEPYPQHPPMPHAATTPSAYWQSRGEIRPQKTGATWDDGLPAPLRVSRRSFEAYEYPHLRRGSAPVTQQPQSRPDSRRDSQQPSRNGSAVPSRTGTPVPIQTHTVPRSSMDDLSSKIASISVDPVQSHVPGGRMAELIERGY